MEQRKSQKIVFSALHSLCLATWVDEDRLDYVGLKTAWLAERLTCVENGHVASLTQKK